MPARVAVVGNINIDFLLPTSRPPEPGENLVADDLQLQAGGKGANQAVAAARLGAEVYMVGRVGKDPFGTLLRQNLEREGIDTARVSVDSGKPTGSAFVMVLPSGENAILSALGANLQLLPPCIEDAFASIEELDMILVQMGIPLESVDRVIQIGADRGVPVLLDPTPLRGQLPRLWRYASVITPNQSEAAALAGMEVDSIGSALAAAEALHERGVRRVVVKLGSRGCVIFDDDGGRRVKAYEVQAMDSTGAGDAFAAALGVALAEGQSFDDAAIMASAAAAIACTKVGAQASLPERSRVDGFVSRRGKRKMLASIR
ncbi:MAG: ribokinase [Armatimonadetes bacterium]|nr:ribokinase [Armatimonadota bacterium]